MQNKVALVIAIVAAFAVVGFAVVSNITTTSQQQDIAVNAQVVRDSSHRLSTADNEKAVLVEFLDFECEACAAVYPLVEKLRAEYGGRVTFVSRYFPLPGHPNSMNAAKAVEAAAQQGAFEAMYQRMFETQAEWSHTEESQAEVFRKFAADLGLDMAAYDQSIDDTATAARITLDKSDGVGLGVSGTPTFFLDGQKIQPSSEDEFRALLEEAIRN